jgi:hypothetical protein
MMINRTHGTLEEGTYFTVVFYSLKVAFSFYHSTVLHVGGPGFKKRYLKVAQQQKLSSANCVAKKFYFTDICQPKNSNTCHFFFHLTATIKIKSSCLSGPENHMRS